jgi:hypothetical protein
LKRVSEETRQDEEEEEEEEEGEEEEDRFWMSFLSPFPTDARRLARYHERIKITFDRPRTEENKATTVKTRVGHVLNDQKQPSSALLLLQQSLQRS